MLDVYISTSHRELLGRQDTQDTLVLKASKALGDQLVNLDSEDLQEKE